MRLRPNAGPSCTTSSATTAARARACSRRSTSLELVPDVSDRDVYLCGPTGMTAALERTVRAANVPRRQIHVERFALT